MLVKMRGSNGETVTFGDKTVRMVSQVSIVLYVCTLVQEQENILSWPVTGVAI